MIDKKNFPNDPGCYLFINSTGKVIYVGKAKNLKKRVLSYFRENIQDKKTFELSKEVKGVWFFATSNEVEALVLENNLINKYKPKYNINLKDSRRYAYIEVTKEEFPRLLVARERKKGSKVYGPFTNAENRDVILKTLSEKFKIRTCKRLPKKACLRYHIGLCSAPCIKNISLLLYNKDVKRIEKFLAGGVNTLLKDMREEMQEHSKHMRFELAKRLRDQVSALEFLSEKQTVEKQRHFDQDIINYVQSGGLVYLMVFNINKGMLLSRQEFVLDEAEDFLEEFIKRHYSSVDVPKEIIIPKSISDNSIASYLAKLRKGAFRFVVPKQGSLSTLLTIVRRNIEIRFFSHNKKMEELQNVLRLNALPVVIECFDISNTQGTLSVGSMVRFENGIANKNEYRRFKIRTVEGSNDFASINEIVSRRYKRLKIEGRIMPDLIIIDGGAGQLKACLNALKKLELKIPCIGLAKKSETIVTPGRDISLDKNNEGLKLLIQIRDEAHRFAIAYHRLLRKKRMLNKDE